jgi:hypothetical protein
MKKLSFLLTAFAFVALTTGSALAQTTIDASAEVRANLAVAQEQETNFGLVDNDFGSSSDPELDPSDGTNSNIIDDADVTVGLVSVAGTGDQTVDVVVPTTEITLTEAGSGSDVIQFAPTYNWTYDDLVTGVPSNPEIPNETADFDMTLDGTGQTDDGTNTILIGGTLSNPDSTPLTPGTYSGTGSITVSYQ